MTEAYPIPDAALDADIAILGIKGSGKTYTAKGIVERLLADKSRVVILDPLSTWWGLRASSDGLGQGFPIAVFGGPHGGHWNSAWKSLRDNGLVSESGGLWCLAEELAGTKEGWAK